VTTAPLSYDEIIFSIPRESALSAETSRLGELLRELKSLDRWTSLILVLIYESAQREGGWKAYLDLLPESFDTLMYWDQNELEKLQASAVVGKIGKVEAEEGFLRVLKPVLGRHLELFGVECLRDEEVLKIAHRMASIVMSYSFDLEVPTNSTGKGGHGGDEGESDEEEEDDDDEKGYYKAMIPFADLFNADGDAENNCRLFQTPTHLQMKTVTAVPANTQLLNTYGSLPNSDLLRRYGYTSPRHARYDVVEVPSQMIIHACIPNGNDVQERIDYLLDEGILDDSFDFEAESLDVPQEVVVTLRTLLLSEQDFRAHKQAEKLPSGTKIDIRTAEVLIGVLGSRLGEYATSVEDDQNLLENKIMVLEKRERDAVVVRLGEKMILVGVIGKLRGLIVKKREAKAVDPEAEFDRSAKRVKI
jgi:SET domain-containing protein 6